MRRRCVQPSLGPVPDGMGPVPLKLGLEHLVTLGLHDLLESPRRGSWTIGDCHREGVKPVVLGECPLVAGDPRQLKE